MQLEYELRTEIEFWRDAIETRHADTSDAMLNRMVLARSLAEQKLELLLEEEGPLIN